MLGTLIKHEWNYIWKKMLLFLAVIVVATIIGALSFGSLAQIESGDIGGIILTICGFLSYYGMLITVSFGFLIILAVRFYKNVYGDEAYITHTLPATSRQIYVSKVLVSSVGMLVVSLGLLVSISFVMDSVVASVETASDSVSIFDIYEAIGISGAGFIAIIVLMIIVSSFANVTMIYCSIVLGQNWKKHKIIGAIVWYVAITFALSIVGVICTAPLMMISSVGSLSSVITFDVSEGDVMSLVFLLSTITTLAVGLVTYFIADHGITKKLNLD